MTALVLPVVAGASSVLATGAVLFRWIRPKFTVRVNCWFCNKDTVVPYGNKNCWDCPHCEQYNGFAEDGGYNKPIPAQYDESLNFPVSGSKPWTDTAPATNGLCDECNRNQHLKIVATSKFVPQNADDFDNEVDNFKQYLDRAYRLCRHCEAVLRQTLGQQDSWLRPKLLGYRLQESGKHSYSTSSSAYNPFLAKPKLPWYLTALRLLALVVVTTAFTSDFIHLEINSPHTQFHLVSLLPKNVLLWLDIVHQYCCYLIVIGLFCVGTVLLTGRSSLRSVDTASFLLWMVLCFVHEHFMVNFLNLAAENVNVLQPASCIATGIITLCSLFWSRKPPRFQRIKQGSTTSDVCSSAGYTKTQNYSNGTASFEFGPYLQDNHISTSAQKSGRGLNTSLGAMSLGTPTKGNRKSGVFSMQKYSTPSQVYSHCRISPLSYMELQHRKPILSPPRLQYRGNSPPSSWVSNDTWNVPPYQRIGLWSKGFSSSASCVYSPNHGRTSPPGGRYSPRPFSVCGDAANLFGRTSTCYSPSCPPSRPTSRQGSVCGDDRASVYSEPVYSPLSTYQPDCFSMSNGKLNHENVIDRNSEGNNSSRSSSACPVDTTTASVDTYTKDANHGFSWHMILLFLSISINVTAISYFVFHYTMNNLLFPPFSLSTKS